MRKPIHSTFSSSFLSNGNCNGPSYLDCLFTQENHTAISSLATFTSCTWRNCQATDGGVIYRTGDSTVALTVEKGEFYSCTASRRGGGIYVEGIGKVSLTNTLFHECIGESSTGSAGGGTDMRNIQKPPQIEGCLFLSCKSGDDGGGLGIWNSPIYQETCVKRCIFMKCQLSNAAESGGGGIIVWSSYAAVGCSECIFSGCSSAWIGGALCFDISFSQTLKETPLVVFSFFNKNTAKDKCGNDAYFVEWTPDEPFLHSFSTSASFRISNISSYSSWRQSDYYQHEDNWLCLDTLSSLNFA